jgi:hypothetical protein
LRAIRAADRFEVARAGSEAVRLHPFAIRVMDEAGVDLRGYTSKKRHVHPRLEIRRSGRR